MIPFWKVLLRGKRVGQSSVQTFTVNPFPVVTTGDLGISNKRRELHLQLTHNEWSCIGK